MTDNGRLKNGRFAPGNTFAKGHGAPARNTNALKTGEFMQFEEGETPYERLRGGASMQDIFCGASGVNIGRKKRKQRTNRPPVKVVSITGLKSKP